MFDDIVFSEVKDEADILPLLTVTEEDDEKLLEDIPDALPLLALKNTVLFPGIVIPITVGRDKSIKAVDSAFKSGKLISVFSQISLDEEDPGFADLYEVGTVAKILKLIKMPDGSVTAILQGRNRVNLLGLAQEDPFIMAQLSSRTYESPKDKLKFEALISSIRDQSKKIINLTPHIPNEASVMLKNIKSNSFLLNFIASNLTSGVDVKQGILETDDLMEKGNIILTRIDKELQILKLKAQIESKVRGDIEKQQRDYFLGQQLKTIQEELGGNPQEEEIKKLEVRGLKKSGPRK